MEDLLTMYGDELFDDENECYDYEDFYKEDEEELSDDDLLAIMYTAFECTGR